jgi:hypothetical protein
LHPDSPENKTVIRIDMVCPKSPMTTRAIVAKIAAHRGPVREHFQETPANFHKPTRSVFAVRPDSSLKTIVHCFRVWGESAAGAKGEIVRSVQRPVDPGSGCPKTCKKAALT